MMGFVTDRDPYGWWQNAVELHRCGGHRAQAEAAYRRAIAGGMSDAWLGLGSLLTTQRGREHDAEAAFRAAMASENLETAASAAIYLGELVDLTHDDLATARACYEFAERHGNREVGFRATQRLIALLAYQGDVEAAWDRMRSFAIWYGDERNVDMSSEGESGMPLLIKIASGRHTREAFRRALHLRGRVSRSRRDVFARSERLTSWSDRVAEVRTQVAKCFWDW